MQMVKSNGSFETYPTNPHAENFADELRIVGGLEDCPETDRVLDAFRQVPREAFAGPGPWIVRSVFYDMVSRLTPDADPRWLYHCALIALDEAKGINIGEPSFWARVLSRASICSGSRILQVGAGVGYYTAILGLLAGPAGKVTAYEFDETLVGRAQKNLGHQTGIEVRHGNAVTDLGDEGPFDLIIGFAGVTHVPTEWVRQLAPEGRVLLPLTGMNGWGAMVLAAANEDNFIGKTLGRCGFYPCTGARNDVLAQRLDKLWAKEVPLDGGEITLAGSGQETLISGGKPD